MNVRHLVRAQWDRFCGGVLFCLGGLALVLGWIGVSKEGLTALQIPYVISGGLGGIFLLGLGAVLWLSADIRDEWRKLDAIEAAISRSPASVSALATGLPQGRERLFDEPAPDSLAARIPVAEPPRQPLSAPVRRGRRPATETQ